jgi:hypothetical protein
MRFAVLFVAALLARDDSQDSQDANEGRDDGHAPAV